MFNLQKVGAIHMHGPFDGPGLITVDHGWETIPTAVLSDGLCYLTGHQVPEGLGFCEAGE